MKSTTIGILLFLVVVGVGVFLFAGKGENTGQVVNNSPGEGNGEVHVVTLSMKDYNYAPDTITVKAGSPVRIYLDSSVYGCFRDFTIRAFGIRKNLKTPNDYVEFTPDKPGRYSFACSMGMGRGTIIVD